jgi:elongation factor P
MESNHRTPGNLSGFVQAKLRNLRNGRSLVQRFNSSESVEVLSAERRTLEFSYKDRDTYVFFDTETNESIELAEVLIGESKDYLVPDGQVDVLFVDDQPVTVELPGNVTLRVTEASDGVRGDTGGNAQKTVVCETGLVVSVPLFVKQGDSIRVSTSDGSYQSRA